METVHKQAQAKPEQNGHAGELANFFQLTIGDHGGEAVFHGGVAMENF